VPRTNQKKPKPPPRADDLVRESAGAYRTGDGRFEVQKSDVGWYLIDTAQANEFGQQLIHGPMPTLDALRAAIPAARDIKPLLRSQPRRGRPTPVRPEPKRTESPPPPPPTWIDKLADREARDVRRLIRALEREGVADAEELVKRHRGDSSPTIATRLIERRLRALVEEWPEGDRERAHELVRRVAAVLTNDGTLTARPLPRWAVEALDPGTSPERPIRLRL
jgi:hypothetical protein